MRVFPIALLGVAVALPLLIGHAGAAGNSINTVSTFAGDSSLVLDADGNPVIAYRDALTTRLEIMHCDDPLCTGGGETVASPDPQPGQFPSLALDQDGNPIVSYYTTMFDRIKVLHCDDPDCAGTEVPTTPDPGIFLVEWPTSMALDGDGNPVIAYSIESDEVRIMHCNDEDCAGNDESITLHDDLTEAPSLVLDGDGNPVVAYHIITGPQFKAGAIRVMHCNDEDCSGGGESFTTPDGTGTWPSLRLDATGKPVLAYYSGGMSGDLEVMHCDDESCSGAEIATTVDATNNTGFQPSLLLDGGNPLVTYHDQTNGDLKLLRCDDPNCTGGNDFTTTLDATGDAGEFSSPVLDGFGNPAITYDVGSSLKIIRCTDFGCKGIPTPTPPSPVGGIAELPDVSSRAGRSSDVTVAIVGGAVVVSAAAVTLWRSRGRRPSKDR
jgi:hypothetical protein